MSRNKLLILFVLRVLVFLLFTGSGILKLYPSVLPFEKQLVDLGFADWCTSPYLARFIIALELGLGIAFLQSNYLRKIIIPATVLLLLVFCVHLSYTIFEYGANSGNCGCFGQLIPMTPLQALIKNIFTLGVLAYIYMVYKEKSRNNILYLIILFLAVNLLVFLIYPFCPCGKSVAATGQEEIIVVPPDTSYLYENSVISEVKDTAIVQANPTVVKTTKDKEVKKDTVQVVATVKKDALCPDKSISSYASFKRYNDCLLADPDDGRKLMALFNVECEHCMETAKKIGELAKKKKIPQMYILFWGSEDKVESFFQAAQYKFPYKIIDPGVFFQLLGTAPSPPKLTYLCNGNVVAEFDSNSFSIENLEKALAK